MKCKVCGKEFDYMDEDHNKETFTCPTCLKTVIERTIKYVRNNGLEVHGDAKLPTVYDD